MRPGASARDDDCDGSTDEDLMAVACGSDVGECRAGLGRCEAGVVVCEGAIEASEETCNGRDDDCDGIVDPAGEGRCALGSGTVACVTVCGSEGTGECSDACEIAAPAACDPPAEACDYADDDCDGAVDEGLQVVRAGGALGFANGLRPHVVSLRTRTYMVGTTDGALVMREVDVDGSTTGPTEDVSDAGASVARFDVIAGRNNDLIFAWIDGGRLFARRFTWNAGELPRFATPTRSIGSAFARSDIALAATSDRVLIAYSSTSTRAQIASLTTNLGSPRFSNEFVQATDGRGMALSASGENVLASWRETISNHVAPVSLSASGVPTLDESEIMLGLPMNFLEVATAPDGDRFFVYQSGARLHGFYWDQGAGLDRSDGAFTHELSATSLTQSVERRIFDVVYRNGGFEVFYLDGSRTLWRGRLAESRSHLVEEEALGSYAEAQSVGFVPNEGDVPLSFVLGTATEARLQQLGCF